MICPNCKANVEEGSTICKACGTRIERESYHFKSTEEPLQPVYYEEEGISSKKLIAIIGSVVAAIAVIVGISLYMAMNAKEVIDLSKYIEVTCTGYEGYATATVTLDTEALENAIISNAKFEGSSDADSDDTFELAILYWEQIYDALSSVEVNIKSGKNGSLENGDTFKVTFDYENKAAKELGLKFRGKTKTYTVKDLDEVKTDDVFRYILIEFDGTTENATATLVSSRYKDFEFTLSQSENLEEGDEITVSIPEETVERLLVEKGVIPEETEKSYTVEVSE